MRVDEHEGRERVVVPRRRRRRRRREGDVDRAAHVGRALVVVLLVLLAVGHVAVVDRRRGAGRRERRHERDGRGGRGQAAGPDVPGGVGARGAGLPERVPVAGERGEQAGGDVGEPEEEDVARAGEGDGELRAAAREPGPHAAGADGQRRAGVLRARRPLAGHVGQGEAPGGVRGGARRAVAASDGRRGAAGRNQRRGGGGGRGGRGRGAAPGVLEEAGGGLILAGGGVGLPERVAVGGEGGELARGRAVVGEEEEEDVAGGGDGGGEGGAGGPRPGAALVDRGGRAPGAPRPLQIGEREARRDRRGRHRGLRGAAAASVARRPADACRGGRVRDVGGVGDVGHVWGRRRQLSIESGPVGEVVLARHIACRRDSQFQKFKPRRIHPADNMERKYPMVVWPRLGVQRIVVKEGHAIVQLRLIHRTRCRDVNALFACGHTQPKFHGWRAIRADISWLRKAAKPVGEKGHNKYILPSSVHLAIVRIEDCN